MLKVTENAKQLLKETLLSHSDDPQKGVRLTTKPPGEFGIVLDREAEGDQVVEHEGAKVLLVAAELAPLVDGNTLDVKHTRGQPTLVIYPEGSQNTNQADSQAGV